MGMFDTVIIEDLKKIKLSKEVNSLIKKSGQQFSNDFQTKDLDNSLVNFYIDKNNQIWEERYVPTGKKKPYEPLFEGWKDKRSFLERLYFNLKNRKFSTKPLPRLVEELKPKKIKSKLTSSFLIYTSKELNNRYVYVDVEVIANEGKVKSFKTVKIEIESLKDSVERLKRDKEFKLKMDESFKRRKEFTSKWYYPILKEIYNPFVFFTAKIIQYSCNKLVTYTYRWHGI